MSSSPSKEHETNSIDKGVSYPSHDHDVVVESNVWRKFDRRILPVASMIYFLSFLDRSNIGNARVAGMQKDLKMTNHQYSIALTITFVSYIAVQLPANLALKYVGPNLMLPTLVILWGIVTILQGVVHNYAGLLACRFFLGLFEGGLFPCLVLYMSIFYPRGILQLRISVVTSAMSIAGAFSGLLAAAIVNLDGVKGKSGWSWIFILEGMFTVLFGFSGYFILPRSPLRVKFLTQQEKTYVSETLTSDGVRTKDRGDDKFHWTEVFKAFTQPQTAFLSVLGFFTGTCVYGMAYFEPTIVAGLGKYTPVRAQLMSVPPFAVASVLAVVSSVLSDKYHARGLTLIFCSAVSIIGFGMFLGSSSDHVRYASLFLFVSGEASMAPPLVTWNANNVAPHCRRATAIALQSILINAGGILSTWLLGSLSTPPKYTKAAITFLVFAIASLLCTVANLYYLTLRNRQKAEIRSKGQDEPRGLGDHSACNDIDYVNVLPWMDLPSALQRLATYRAQNTRASQETFENGVVILKSNAAKKMGDEGWAFLEQLALAAIDIGRIDVADRCLQLLSDKFPGSPRVDCLTGIRMEATESPETVMKYYDELLNVDSANAAIWKRKISVLRRIGKIDSAVDELSQFLDTFYNDVEGWLELADIYTACNQYTYALQSLSHALLLNPQNPFYVLQAAETAYTGGDIPLAIKSFLIVIEMTDGAPFAGYTPTGITVRAWLGIKLCARRLLNEPRLSTSSHSQTPAPKNLGLIDELATEQVMAAYSDTKARARSGRSVEGKTEIFAWLGAS